MPAWSLVQTYRLMMPNCVEFIKPIVYTGHCSYWHNVALNKGTDVDKPKSLKSVTVE